MTDNAAKHEPLSLPRPGASTRLSRCCGPPSRRKSSGRQRDWASQRAVSGTEAGSKGFWTCSCGMPRRRQAPFDARRARHQMRKRFVDDVPIALAANGVPRMSGGHNSSVNMLRRLAEKRALDNSRGRGGRGRGGRGRGGRGRGGRRGRRMMARPAGFQPAPSLNVARSVGRAPSAHAGSSAGHYGGRRWRSRPMLRDHTRPELCLRGPGRAHTLGCYLQLRPRVRPLW